MSVREDGKGQADESEVRKKVWLCWDGECEEKVGENIEKKGGGAFVMTAAPKCVNEKRWKGGNVEIGPKDEWQGGGVAEWKEKKMVPEIEQK